MPLLCKYSAPFALLLASLALVKPTQAQEEVVTVGLCYADGNCSTLGVPIQTKRTESEGILATCHSFLPLFNEGFVCLKLDCGNCAAMVKNKCLAGGYWVEYCPPEGGHREQADRG